MNVHQVEQQVADELLEEGQEGAEDTGGEAREVEENSASGAIQKENDDSDDRVTEGKVGMLLAMIKADRHLLGRVERAVRGVAGKVTNHVILTKTHPVMVNALSLLYSRVLCNQDFPADLTDSLLEQVVTEFTAFLADTILVEDCSGAVFDYVQPISLERVERASADGSERHPCPDCGRQSRVASGLG